MRTTEVRAQESELAGEILFVSNRDGNNEIYVVNADGTQQRNLTNNSANDFDPVWSPDGEKIAFMSDRSGNSEIYVMDADGGNLRNLTNSPANDRLPTWSPDGKLVAFASRENTKDYSDTFYVMNADGDAVRQVAVARYSYLSPPTWSPDSKHFIFFSEQYGIGNGVQAAWETVFVNVETGDFVTNDYYSLNLNWSPTGDQIFFGECGILITDSDNFKPTSLDLDAQFKVSKDNLICAIPYDWSPDGSQIVFSVSFRGDNEDSQTGIYIADVDGKNIHHLTNEDIAYDARWSPDGKQII
ncbi:MAG: hypothetical protein K8F30_02335, partial [Taibaiella sp.]|nr:hypothetical protein [Taibaiella sp.]